MYDAVSLFLIRHTTQSSQHQKLALRCERLPPSTAPGQQVVCCMEKWYSRHPASFLGYRCVLRPINETSSASTQIPQACIGGVKRIGLLLKTVGTTCAEESAGRRVPVNPAGFLNASHAYTS